MKATKIAAFVLMSIVALAVASTVGLALLSNMIPTVETTTSKSTSQTCKAEQAFGHPIRLKGDPIDDPKPNKK